MRATIAKAPAPVIPKEKHFYGRRLLIYRNVRSNEPVADNLWATVADDTLDGKEAQLHDWKWNKEAGTIYVRGAVYHGSGQWQSFENTFPATLESETLKPPGRNFVWNEWGGLGKQWRNQKTGARAGAY